RVVSDWSSDVCSSDLLLERRSSAKITFIQTNSKREPCLIWIVFRIDICSPKPVAFLQPQRLERPAPGGCYAEAPARFPKRVPHRSEERRVGKERTTGG